jgi:hypothetical protein
MIAAECSGARALLTMESAGGPEAPCFSGVSLPDVLNAKRPVPLAARVKEGCCVACQKREAPGDAGASSCPEPPTSCDYLRQAPRITGPRPRGSGNGHSSIQVTYDKYGHLMPGNEEQAAGLLDDYLTAKQAEDAARAAERTAAATE